MSAVGTPTRVGPAATGTEDRNVDGNAVALTVFSTVRAWGRIELPVFFEVLRRSRGSLQTLRELSFIQSARWSLLEQVPRNGPPQPERRLHYAHLYFESNFNGGWEEYIDAFSYLLRWGMFGFWGSSIGFPGAVPAGPFKDYIRRNAMQASHYYSAYPQATATTITGAGQLDARVTRLREQAPSMSPEEFAVAWRALLTETQAWL